LPFSSLKLHPTLIRGVDKLGFQRPSPIQSKAIPPALEGQDLLACAATGSGKTAAFLLPILHQLVEQPRGTTRGLVLAPTRELACQIRDDLNALAQFTGIKSAVVHGGVVMGPQKTAFRRGTDVIIATPGRLLDHFQHHYATLSGLEYLVLDEADRMLDMGFLPDIRRILQHVPKPKQVFFFSATMPAPIEKLTREILKKPVRITLQRKAAPAEGVSHAVYPVLAKQRGALLVELLRRGHINDALVFTRTKHRADSVAKLLNRSGIFSERIHGNRSQPQRTKALAGFKSGKFRVLVATDIAARGIDVDALGHVVNFDVPGAPEDYIHRVGRTARAEAKGEAITLVMPESENDLQGIERALGLTIPRIHLEDFPYDIAPGTPPHPAHGNTDKPTQRAGNRERKPANAGNTDKPTQRAGNRKRKPANAGNTDKPTQRAGNRKRKPANAGNTDAESKHRPRRRFGKRRTS
jgi:ATP-dependent RNA helicase RhlE